MPEGELVDVLQEAGFKHVDSGLPGGWATDGEWTVNIQSKRRGSTSFIHEVRVYDEPAGLIAIGSEPDARTVDSSHELAVRSALDQAGYHGQEVSA